MTLNKETAPDAVAAAMSGAEDRNTNHYEGEGSMSDVTNTPVETERYRMPSGRIATLDTTQPPAAVEDARQLLLDNGAVLIEDQARTEAALVRAFVEEVRSLRDNTTPITSPDDPRVQVLVEARPNLMSEGAEALIAEGEKYQRRMGELHTDVLISKLTSPLVAPAWAEHTSIEMEASDEVAIRFYRNFGETAELVQMATIFLEDVGEDHACDVEWETHPNLSTVALDCSVTVTASTARDIACTFIDVCHVLEDAEREDPPMSASAVMGARNLIKAMRDTGAKNIGELYAMQEEVSK